MPTVNNNHGVRSNIPSKFAFDRNHYSRFLPSPICRAPTAQQRAIVQDATGDGKFHFTRFQLHLRSSPRARRPPSAGPENSRGRKRARRCLPAFDLRNRVLTVVHRRGTSSVERSLAVIEFLGPVPTHRGGFSTGLLVGLCILARSKILSLPGEG